MSKLKAGDLVYIIGPPKECFSFACNDDCDKKFFLCPTFSHDMKRDIGSIKEIEYVKQTANEFNIIFLLSNCRLWRDDWMIKIGNTK